MITDWDAAYSNFDHVADAQSYPPKWMAKAEAYREEMESKDRFRADIRYGDGARHVADLFLPEGDPKGLVVFVHGGYWRAFDKSVFSHLAQGCIDAGWAVGIPSYTLCPLARVADITGEIGASIVALADEVEGPINLTGHSAGGHLVSRMVCTDAPLPFEVQDRIERIVSISGVHDLRPLMRTELNRTLHIDPKEADAESPCLLVPLETTPVTCWVGAAELPEFVRQNDLLANVWTGLGAHTRAIHAAGHHHFSVVDDLQKVDSQLVAAITGSDGWG
ncbi:alpha/beta hydrolase [Tepidamorphus sp. 3E244]|uniref:alpha/beta hydrolase n=1 Tax=Tepidamorphus sp. 3E244 TaxID=3385498 RepID=UPI0038FCA32A